MTHKNNNYNCRVIIYNGKILMIRPKMWMANDGNYVSFGIRDGFDPDIRILPLCTPQRELRHFAPWDKHRKVEEHSLPSIIREVTGQVGVAANF
jgi:NAD+ synthase (glutamine-hydrolysing)